VQRYQRKQRSQHEASQRELAGRRRVPEQQVQRWEANSYQGAGIDRLQEIADALKLQVPDAGGYGFDPPPRLLAPAPRGPSKRYGRPGDRCRELWMWSVATFSSGAVAATGPSRSGRLARTAG
jgi:transcriptional regulator with XRE-family HTH domain